MTSPNVPNVDIEQEKKWLVSRIELLHKSVLDEYRIIDQLLVNMAKNEIGRVKGRRNNTLTGLGIALTIILGLSTVITIDEVLFFVTMTSIFLIGLVTFVTLNLIMVKEENVFHLIGSTLKEAEGWTIQLPRPCLGRPAEHNKRERHSDFRENGRQPPS